MQSDLYYSYFAMPLAFLKHIIIIGSQTHITHLYFKSSAPKDHLIQGDHLPVFQEVKKQLCAYAEKRLRIFDLPLAPQGTAYQQKIWQFLQEIPYGETVSYKDIADTINSGPRAVGGANRKNPIPLIIPCHRVIRHNGHIGGYLGQSDKEKNLEIPLKQAFLDFEINDYFFG